MNDDLRARTLRAIGHLGAGGAMGKVISLGTTVLMARLLSPADYGLMAIAMVVIGFVSFFNEVGIGAAIVQRTKLSAGELNGCFAVALLAGIVLFGATTLASGPIAGFMGNDRLQPLLSTLAIAFVLGAFGTVPLALLRKDMRFKAIAGLQLSAVLLQSVLALILAWRGFGVWALVTSYVASSAIQSVGAFVLARWRPYGSYAIREAASLVMYGLHITNTRVFWFLYTNADKFIIGRVLGERAVGIYDMAFSLATLPTSQVTTLATNVAGPLFAKLQDDLAKLSTVLLHFTRGVAYITYPALIGMAVCSKELIAVVLGDKWLEMLVPFTALCLMGLVKSVDPLLSQILISTGHAKKLATYTMTCGVVITLSMIGAVMTAGLLGVSLVWLVVYPLLSVKLLHDTAKITGMKMRAYYGTLGRVLLGAGTMGLVVLGVRATTLAMGFPVGAVLMLEIGAGILSYFFWIVYVDRRALGEIRQIMLDLGTPVRRLERWPFTRCAV